LSQAGNGNRDDSGPRSLLEALRQRRPEARARFWREVREPIERLMGQLIVRHHLAHDREQLTLHALHSAETYLRTRDPVEFDGASPRALQAAVMIHVAKTAAQPLATQGAPTPQTEPLPECPAYSSQALFLPYERVGDCWFGGDWLGGATDDDGALWVILADVTGHGYQAYLLASSLPLVWRMCWDAVPKGCRQPVILLDDLHHELEDVLPEGIFVEAVLARLGTDGAVTVAPAGGIRIWLRHQGDTQARLHSLRGAWLGLMPPLAKEQRQWMLRAGEELLLASDGLFDQLAQPDSDLNWLPSAPTGRRPLFEAVRRQLTEQLRDRPQRDDITLVVLQRRSAGGEF
jgi:hypothetical protein